MKRLSFMDKISNFTLFLWSFTGAEAHHKLMEVLIFAGFQELFVDNMNMISSSVIHGQGAC